MMPTPRTLASGLSSITSAFKPCRARATASVRPPMPPPAISTRLKGNMLGRYFFQKSGVGVDDQDQYEKPRQNGDSSEHDENQTYALSDQDRRNDVRADDR